MTKRYRLVKSTLELKKEQQYETPPRDALLGIALCGVIITMIVIFGGSSTYL